MITLALVILIYGPPIVCGLTHDPNWHPSRIEDDPRTVFDGHSGDW